MKPITTEWVSKAEGDFLLLERESLVTENPNYDGICFHAQQCVEKYLKARLCEADVPCESADRDAALQAQRSCQLFRIAVRKSLGLED